MHTHNGADDTAQRGDMSRVLLIGNPNVGKSALFGLLTGKYVTVSNYPGTTVEVAYGNAVLNKSRSLIIDTPGVNSLVPMSEDERVTRDMLLSDRSGVVVQVADAKNLRRGLMITLQLAEMEVPFLLDLNMDDEARGRGIEIDQEELSRLLDIEVVKTVATRRSGIDRLVKGIAHPKTSSMLVRYDDAIEAGARDISALLPEASISRRSMALMLLAGDESLNQWLHAHLPDHVIADIDSIRQDVQDHWSVELRVGRPVEPTEAAPAHDLFDGVSGRDHVPHWKGTWSVVLSCHIAVLGAARAREGQGGAHQSVSGT